MEYIVNTDHLISLIESKPVIWDKDLDEHKLKTKIHAAWREICAEINKDFKTLDEDEQKYYCNFVSKKWRNIKDCWIKWIKKTQSNKSNKRARRYIYDEQLSFLRQTAYYSEFANFSDSATTDDDHSRYFELDEHPSTSTDLKNDPFEQINKKRKNDEDDQSLLTTKEKDDRHLFFIKGILPTLRRLNESQVLKFQMGVLQLVDNIQNNVSEARITEPYNESPQIIFKRDED